LRQNNLAYITAKAVQGWDFAGEPQIDFVNAAAVTGIDTMRKKIDGSRSFPMCGKKAVIILDEAHKLSKPAQEALLAEFESPDSPTVWIICTTDPQKLADGLKAGRCVTLAVKPMGEKDIRTLVNRAADEIKFSGDREAFVKAALAAEIGSPRKILMAFETHAMGTNLTDAIASQTVVVIPEYHDIAFAVCYGKWATGVTLWGKVPVRAVGELLKDLDEAAKKKIKTSETEESESDAIDPEDLMDKNQWPQGSRLWLVHTSRAWCSPRFKRAECTSNRRPHRRQRQPRPCSRSRKPRHLSWRGAACLPLFSASIKSCRRRAANEAWRIRQAQAAKRHARNQECERLGERAHNAWAHQVLQHAHVYPKGLARWAQSGDRAQEVSDR
jgi:hypothetical protein